MKPLALTLCALALAGCATQPPAPAAAGRFVHYRLTGFDGVVIQVEAPNAAACADGIKNRLIDGALATCSDVNAAATLPAVWATNWMGGGSIVQVRFQTMQMCEFVRSELIRRDVNAVALCIMSK